MSKEQKITNNIKVPNKDLEALRLNFPHCFDKDGNFQLEKFKANLTEKEINFSTDLSSTWNIVQNLMAFFQFQNFHK